MSAGVLFVILGAKFVTKKVPGALIAVIGAIFVSWKWDLVSHGVADASATCPAACRRSPAPDISSARSRA